MSMAPSKNLFVNKIISSCFLPTGDSLKTDMPQEIDIVQCYKCLMFQTQIVKKAKTWTCKICNEKQSRKRSYGQGSGKECRERVQQLNEMRKAAEEIFPDLHFEEEEEEASWKPTEDNNVLCHNWEGDSQVEKSSDLPEKQISLEGNRSGFVNKESKWAKYLNQPVEVKSDED